MNRVRECPDRVVGLGNIKKNGCKFSFSKHLKEQPINILLPKETYIELADIHKNITL